MELLFLTQISLNCMLMSHDGELQRAFWNRHRMKLGQGSKLHPSAESNSQEQVTHLVTSRVHYLLCFSNYRKYHSLPSQLSVGQDNLNYLFGVGDYMENGHREDCRNHNSVLGDQGEKREASHTVRGNWAS